ncbi:hypothetical protein [Fodinicola acaciae]|uniref:hypothetical protein n=1 Tax=Fodinicola acaciae TaxID=2681555 RepID=UPI0013D0D2E8|nr:hypothetical protein [Fodinicola acaciae]
MANPLDRLYKTKLQLLAVASTAVGIITLLLVRWLSLTGQTWLAFLPLTELGSTLFATGLLAIFFEYVNRQDEGARTREQLREVVHSEAPAIRDAVVESLAASPDTLRRVASDELLDQVTTNALGLRLGDPVLAGEVYADLRDQIIRAPERWYDVDTSVTLNPWNGGPRSGKGAMFEVTFRCQYKVTPASPTMRFACVSGLEEYNELLRDPATSSVWYLDPASGIDASTTEAYELLDVAVDGKPRKLRRAKRTGSQHYIVDLGIADGRQITISFTYRALVRRHGHLLYLELPRPTKGWRMQLAYGDAGIQRVNTLDFIAGVERARIDRSPATVAARTVGVSYDGWIFPRSGVAFVWVLNDELSQRG